MYLFHNKVYFYGEKLLPPSPTPKLEDHPCWLTATVFLIYLQLPSLLEPFLHPHPEDTPCRGDMDPLIMGLQRLLMLFLQIRSPIRMKCKDSFVPPDSTAVQRLDIFTLKRKTFQANKE